MADRLSQEPVEVVVKPTTQKARLSQESVEVVVQPTTAKARLSQEPAEVVVKPTTAKARLSQESVEVVAKPTTAKARLSQLVVEVLVRPSVVADLALDYPVRAIRDGDLGLSYAINGAGQTQIGADLGIDYALNAAQVGANLGFTYKVAKATKLQQRGQDLRLRYEIIVFAQVGANLDVAYGIAPATSVVGASLTIDAPVQNVVHPGVDLVFTYDIQVPEPIATDLQLDYAISGPATEVVYIFTPQTPAPAPRKTRAVSADLGIDAPICRTIDTGLTIDAPIRHRVGSSLATTYPIRVTAGSEQAMDWPIRYTVGASLGMRWVRYGPKPPARRRARATLLLDWRIDPPTIPTLPAPELPPTELPPHPALIAEPRLRESVAPPPTFHDEPVVEVVAVVEASRLARYSREETLALARRLRIGFEVPGAGGIVAAPTTVTASTPRPHEDNGDREAQRRRRGRAARPNA